MQKFIIKAGIGMAALLLCGAMTFQAIASGGEQPFKIKGTMLLTPVNPEKSPGLYTFVDIGESTYMGRYRNEGWIQFNADLTIAAGAGRCTSASGDYNNWKMEPNTGRCISLGGIGRFEGVTGYFDSNVLTLVPNEDGTISATYTGEGKFTFPNKNKK